MATPYIGSKISLISRLDIRYEGTLHSVDPVESTISLSQVRSFGTEDRAAPVPVPGRKEIYEFIIFKATDIKDLIVCESPKPVPTVDDITYDPAIISVSKPPPQGVQTSHQPAAIDERSSAQEYSHASSPQQPVQPGTDQRFPGQQLMGGFGQSAPRSYYNRAMHPPQLPQQYNQPPPPLRTYHSHQQHRQEEPHYQQGQQNRGYYNQQQRQPQRGGFGHSRGGVHGVAPRFDGDFDFEQANEQFRDTVEVVTDKLAKAELQDKQLNSNRSSARNSEERAEPKSGETFYDKSISFFDNISCEAQEKAAGGNNRPDWKKEVDLCSQQKELGQCWQFQRMTNAETFGQTAVRMQHNRRGRGAYRGGGGYYHYQQQQNQQQPQQQYYPQRRGGFGNAGGRVQQQEMSRQNY